MKPSKSEHLSFVITFDSKEEEEKEACLVKKKKKEKTCIIIYLRFLNLPSEQ